MHEYTSLQSAHEFSAHFSMRHCSRHSINLVVQEGESALMKASARGYFDIIQLIITHRAILDLKSKVRLYGWITVH